MKTTEEKTCELTLNEVQAMVEEKLGFKFDNFKVEGNKVTGKITIITDPQLK